MDGGVGGDAAGAASFVGAKRELVAQNRIRVSRAEPSYRGAQTPAETCAKASQKRGIILPTYG